MTKYYNRSKTDFFGLYYFDKEDGGYDSKGRKFHSL